MEVLIYGPRKSGTSMFQRLIDGSDIFVHPRETKIKFFLHPENCIHKTYLDKLYPLFKKSNIEGFDFETYKKKILEKAECINNLKSYVELDVHSVMKGFNIKNANNWAIKEVGGNPTEIIDSFLHSFPSGKVLIINRKPDYITKAIFTDRKRRGIKLTLIEKIKQAIRSFSTYKIIEEIKPNTKIFVVEYENIIKDTKKEMKNVSKFLKVKYNKIFEIPTLNGKEHFVQTASKKEKGVFKTKTKLYQDLSITEYVIIRITPLLIKIKNTLT